MQSNNGFYGEFGGQFIPETLIPALDELEKAFNDFKKNESAIAEFNNYLNDYVGRPTPVYFARNLSKKYGFNLFLSSI